VGAEMCIRDRTGGYTGTGDSVNLEIDTLARYVARLQEWPG